MSNIEHSSALVPRSEWHAALKRIGELEAEVEACKRHHEKSIVKCRERLEGAVSLLDRAGAALNDHEPGSALVLEIATWVEAPTVTGGQYAIRLLPDAPLSDDTELVFIDGRAFVNAAKHEQVVDAMRVSRDAWRLQAMREHDE